MNSSNITFNTNQVYFVITDSLADADGGLGTDILTNIDELFFDDKGVRLSVFKDPWGGFIEGTSFGDTITGEGVDENIVSGDGADRVSGGAGADRAELGKGNDFFDGGSNSKDFDARKVVELNREIQECAKSIVNYSDDIQRKVISEINSKIQEIEINEINSKLKKLNTQY